ncbi:aminotransferase class I/II-fold pyridoxal phosphate-dependent enzyme [Infirmifilum sp. NZ]|uniref:aminotransferase class I/II-fold pyridoxal phosphate-dependent enzyme n=1 Tax=Infirmifilum sp. NZ TaxID=2926850 RepID=UPI0027A6167F|nr:aminotransferase class I/II-fold pyridoxal phosphate-dependent enzyme [Infirmifilum sp. NZ]UNQ73997.1 aminotransferase class I/II-fold pyridoxal phosphate-dependent enzyme [Infirmifilum sp. NZ]
MSKVLGLSKRISRLDYPIRKYNALARSLEEKGEKVIYLNIGDPLKYDFQTPRELIEEAYRAMLENHNYYASSEGVRELQEAIAYKEKVWNGVEVESRNVLVTSGVSEGINALFAALVDDGEKVLIPDPSYPLYINFADFYNANKVFYPLVEEEGWVPDTDRLRRLVDNNVKFIVVNNPHNPTGAVYPVKTIKEILDIAAEWDIPVVSDEIYDALTFEGEFVSTARVASKDNVVIGLNGFSKTFLATGWRLGYVYLKGPEEKVSQIRSAILAFLMTRLSAVTPLQVALARFARRKPLFLEEVRRKMDERRRFTFKRLNEIPGFRLPVAPAGAFYAFPRVEANMSDEEFARRLLLEEKVFVVYGSGFGPVGAGHVRLVFLPPLEVLEEAFNRIERFMRRIQRTS